MRCMQTAASAVVGFSVCAIGAFAQVHFTDRSEDAGVVNVGFGRGAAMVDFDGDGRLDLFAANTGPDAIYRQKDDGTFEEMTTSWGLPVNDDPTWVALASDFDNDGDPDLLLLVGGFVDREVPEMSFGGAGVGIEGLPNVMLRNDLASDGVFTDVTASSGAVGTLITGVFGGTALDYDRDGDLDVFLANQPETQAAHLLRNDGDLFFTDVSVEAGMTHTGDFRHVGSGDIDNDGWTDVGVANQNGPNLLYRNNGDGTFSEIAESAGVQSLGKNFGMVFVDLDNDGWMDLYLPKHDRSDVPVASPRLFLNNKDNTFRDVTSGSGIGVQSDMGHTVADLDADGYPDILSGTGGPSFLEGDRLYLLSPDGNGGLTATDVSTSSGIQAAGETRQHGQAVGDYDGDGDLDIYSNNGGPFVLAETAQGNFLWQNDGNANSWVGFDLQGVVSNLGGVGTRVRVETASGRNIFRYRDCGRGFGNTNAPTVHVGLGDESEIAAAEFHWQSGIEQVILAPTSGQRHVILETGILGPATAAIDSTYEFTVYGAAGLEVSVITADTAASSPRLMEKRGGFALLDPPVTFHDPVTIGADGTVTASVVIPDDSDLIGTELFIQTWIHEPGVTEGGALSNLLTIEIIE